MARSTNRFPSRGHGPKRLTEWGAFEVRSRTIALTGTSIGNQSTGVIANERLTVIRLRGHGFIHLDAGAVEESLVVGIGLIIAPSEAFTAGVGSLPTPLADMDAPWIWHDIFPMGPAVIVADDGGDLSRNVQFTIDNKAMRKFRTGEELGFVVEADVVSGTPNVDVFVAARQLFKLT